MFDPHTEQLHVDGNKSLIYAHLAEMLAPASGKFDVPGAKGFVPNQRLVRQEHVFQPDPSKSAAWNRGAYLVNGHGHCAECHSPRNALGGIVKGQRFAGGPNPVGEGWVPNITQKGLADYSEADIAEVLATGTTPDGDSVGGPMAEVVRTTGQLSPEDRAAVATYIKSLPPVQGPQPPKKPEQK